MRFIFKHPRTANTQANEKDVNLQQVTQSIHTEPETDKEPFSDDIVDVQFAEQSDLITFKLGDTILILRSKQIKSEHLAELAERFMRVLKFRQALPATLKYEEREPPSLLTLPRELRDKIYRYCGVPVARTSSQYHVLLDCPAGYDKYDMNPRPTKKRRTDAAFDVGFPAAASEPRAIVRMKGPCRFSDLRLVCRQMHDELVGEIFRDHCLQLRVDTTSVPAGKVIHDFWTLLIPNWLMGLLREVSIEIRCSMSQWIALRGPLCIKLRSILGQLTFKIRLVITYPKAEGEAFMATLPSYCQPQDLGFLGAWFFADARLRESEFEIIKQLRGLEVFQILHLDNVNFPDLTELLNAYKVGYAIVFKKYENEWQKSVGKNIRYDAVGMHFNFDKASRVENLR